MWGFKAGSHGSASEATGANGETLGSEAIKDELVAALSELEAALDDVVAELVLQESHQEWLQQLPNLLLLPKHENHLIYICGLIPDGAGGTS